MKISQLLAVLKQQNVRLSLDGERLLCHLPHDDYKLPTQLAGGIRDNKAELLTILKSRKTSAAKLAPVEPAKQSSDSYPLSSQQENLWFADQFEQGLDYSYNNAGAIHFDGKLDTAIMQQCFNDVIKRHQSLRTRFFAEQGKPRQAVNAQFAIELPVIQIDDENEIDALIVAHAQHLFDLTSGQLLKITLLKLSEVKHILAFNIHHIVSDGWSIRILFQELKTLYSGYLNKGPSLGLPAPEFPTLNLPALNLQYHDYATWQHQLKQQGGFNGHLKYWENQLKGAPQLLELATDHVRPPVQDHRGETIIFTLPDELKQQLNSLSIANGASLFMTLLAGFKILLWRYTQQTDLLIGSPIANRGQKSLEDLIGFFVNTLVLRTQIDKTDTVASLLAKVKSATLGAYDHQELPFELLVNHLNPDRSLSHSPIFQVLFVLQNTQIGQLELPGLDSQLNQTDNASAKFDLNLELSDDPKGLTCRLEYAAALFEPSTINQMIQHYKTLLEGMVKTPAANLVDLPILSMQDQYFLLHTANKTQTDFPVEQCIHSLFEQTVRMSPNNIALICNDKQWSYQNINEKANQLAYYLRSRGVKADSLVGLCLERSVEMVIGLWGILKSGGAYVPLDPGYPQDRLDYMVKDSGIEILLSQSALNERFDADIINTVLLDDVLVQQLLEDYSKDNLNID
jgi:hypothetical protein